jgi:hypothetical protein
MALVCINAISVKQSDLDRAAIVEITGGVIDVTNQTISSEQYARGIILTLGELNAVWSATVPTGDEQKSIHETLQKISYFIVHMLCPQQCVYGPQCCDVACRIVSKRNRH